MANDTTTPLSALQIIKSAMRSLNIIASGEEIPAEEAEDAFGTLNGMLEAWSAERAMVFTIQRQVFVPATLKQTYTVGPNGDFNIPRPVQLPRMGVIILTNPNQPLELPMEMLSSVGWEGIPVKNITSTIPLKAWDDQGYPYRNISVWPVPSTNINFALYTWTLLNIFADLTTKYSFPNGYISMMKYNLAIRLAPEFGVEIPPAITNLAAEAKARVGILNYEPQDLRCDSSLVNPGRGAYDWRSDQPAGKGW